MPNYRVYYTERAMTGQSGQVGHRLSVREGRLGSTKDSVEETEWEEEVEARNTNEALESFFREHSPDRSQVMRVDDEGETREIEGIGDFDPETTYIWVEGDKMMEYQGMDEVTPGMVTCPLCGGEGEVEEAIAEEFLGDQEGEDQVTLA